MTERSLSVREFQRILQEELREVCVEYAWNYSSNVERGYAFQHWCANVVAGAEQTFDTDPEDAVLLSRDLKADMVFEDTNANHLLIAQCKHTGRDGLVDESEVKDFFSRHDLFMDPEWIRKHGSNAVVSALVDYRDRVTSGWSISYYFFSNGKASTRVHSVAEKAGTKFQRDGLNISCRLFDFSPLKEYYVTSLTLEQAIPDVVHLDLPRGKYFEKEYPHPTVVAVLKGNALRNLARQHRQALFAWNIRGYLGNRGINKAIAATAADRAGDFFYFNNGVSAICTDFTRVDGRLSARHFQIINGAQTVSTLSNVEEDPDIEVLFRLTKTLDVKTEKGFNQEIIQYNNSQNQIKVSDFRSNDPIQLHLEQAFAARKARGPLPKLRYLRKRMVGRRGKGVSVKLEDFAKVRYAFLYEPTLVHSAPKSLWSLGDSGGVYEMAFGVDGKLEASWSTETFEEALVALAFYLRIDEEAKALAKADSELRFLRRLRFHGAALAGEYARRRFVESDEINRLTTSSKRFDEAWGEFWPMAKGILIDVFSQAEDDGSSMFAFVRSGDRWHQMTKRLGRHVAAV